MKYHKHSYRKHTVFQHEDPLQNSDYDIEGLFDALFTPPRDKSETWVEDAYAEYQRIVKVYRRCIAYDASQEDDADEDVG